MLDHMESAYDIERLPVPLCKLLYVRPRDRKPPRGRTFPGRRIPFQAHHAPTMPGEKQKKVSSAAANV